MALLEQHWRRRAIEDMRGAMLARMWAGSDPKTKKVPGIEVFLLETGHYIAKQKEAPLQRWEDFIAEVERCNNGIIRS